VRAFLPLNNRLLATTVLVIIIVGAAVVYFVFQQPTTEVPPTGDVKQFALTARQWEFNQTRIDVNAGDTVIINVTGLDDGLGTGHGFAISEFNVNQVIRSGETRTIQFVASRSGTFTFFCSVPCGSGHNDMRGTLVVAG
jgi:cytochrome c oxidase subunit 2